MYQLLEEALQNPLVTVVAGAGYGKTYLVYAFVHKQRYRTIWMQLSERDNNPVRFWEHVVQSVACVNQERAAQLEGIGFPETNRQFDRCIGCFQEGITSEKQYVLVYDDFHLLHEKMILDFLERFFTVFFANMTFVLISRNKPALNTVTFFARGLLSNITEDDLRFNPEEIGEYFQMLGITLPDAAVQELYQDTKGWIFALQLAGISLKQGNSVGDYGRSAMRSDIFTLIESGIFSCISADLQKYLISLSLIEHWPLTLLTALAPDPHLIQEMEGIGSFISYDIYLHAYQIHPLLLEYLSEKQRCLTAEEKKTVYTQTARWCAAHNLKIDAISYYEKAGAYAELIQMTYSFPMAMSNHVAGFLLTILDRAPPETYLQNAAAYILYTRILFTLGRFGACACKLHEIIRRFEALPPSRFNHRVLYGCYNNLGFVGMLSSLYTQQYDFASFFERAYHYYTLTDYELQGPSTSMSLGSYVSWFGNGEKDDLEQYNRAISASVPYISASMNGCTYGMDDLILAEQAYFKGDIPKAERLVYQTLYKAQAKKQYEIETRGIFYLLRINLSRGNYDAIEALFTRLDAQLEMQEYTDRYACADMVRGWFYAQIGCTTEVALWLQGDFKEIELHSLIYGMEVLVQAKYYLAAKNYPRVLDALRQQASPYGPEQFLLGNIEANILEAVCRYHTAAKADALRALERAYRLALPHSLDMPFIEMGTDMALLACAALKDSRYGIPREWLEKIRRQASAYGKQCMLVAAYYRKGDTPPPVFLSPRERTILRYLSQGFTREEIAEEEALSINTVKNTISGMYRKLGAVNRADAIRIAVAGGMLEAGGILEDDRA
ncbi:MAG: LuxR C-terminal-related transcriptional regulator [Treponema sp.]|jgi:LuxR family maltose regulon positive regulatory protein|nr:LuxR C-terminal-related transcriptional regulator [Treponema sp.]